MLAAGPIAASFLALAPLVQGPRAYKDDLLRPLASLFSDQREAHAKGEGVDEVRAALQACLESLRTPLDGRDPLRQPADIGRAEWLSWPRPEQKQQRGRIQSEVYREGSFAVDGFAYAYRLPKDYDPSTRSYPLLISIPDEGEKPADHLRQHWVLRDLLEGAILFVPSMPQARAEWDRVVVEGRPGGLSHVLTAYRLATETLAVDPDRVFVAGRGKGVPAAIAAGNYGPQRFAGVIGRAGDAGEIGPENFSDLPTLFVSAGANATAFQTRAKERGQENCTLLPEGDEQDVWSWMLAHPRDPAPERVRIVVGTPFPTRVHWLRVAPTAMDTHAEASIDRTTNTIQVDCVGSSHVAFFLNDALVDLDRPVRFVVNGVESTARVRRSLATALNLLAEGISDAGSFYVAQHVCELGEKAGVVAADTETADPEYEQRLADAGSVPDRLWELHEWCQGNGRPARAEQALRRLLRYEPDHGLARAALGQVRQGDQWFESEEARASWVRSQDAALASAKGHVLHQGLWVHPEERAAMNKGWSKDQATGQWLTPADKRRLREGWVRQDLAWIAPDEAARVDEGLWLVDGEWLDLSAANRAHSEIHSPWVIPTRELLLTSTADREVALRAARVMRRGLEDLRKVFGAEPPLPLPVAILRDEEQYDRLAFGDPDGRRPPTHVARLQIIHSAYFAESWYERVASKHEFRGQGVCYWDALAPNGDLYGVHAARLALGLSYAEALDPSKKAVKKAATAGPPSDYYTSYQAEKVLPAWLRWGGAVYAERYYEDSEVPSDGDPWWTRKWSIENLVQRGGLRPLPEVLAFPIDPDDRGGSLKLLIECGLLVAFLVDGDCAPVHEEHARFQQALASGRLHPNGIEALQQALLEHEAELRAFAGL